MTKCHEVDHSHVLEVETKDALFATEYVVKMGANSRCGFLAKGDTRLYWELPDEGSSTLWNFAVNYTGDSCQPYGGETIEEAARNVTRGLWLLKNKENCAFYVVVGNLG